MLPNKVRYILVVLLILLAFGASAQEVRAPKHLPSSLTWHLDAKDARIDWLNADYAFPLSDEWIAWKRPMESTLVLGYFRPQDFDCPRADKKFFDAVKKLGYKKAPAWVAVQLYLDHTLYLKEGIWIPLEEITAGEIPRFGCTKSQALTSSYCSRPDLYRGNPNDSRASDIWLFVKISSP